VPPLPLLPLDSVPSRAICCSRATLYASTRVVGPLLRRHSPVRRHALLHIVAVRVEMGVEVMREEVGEGESGSGGEGHGAARRVLLCCFSHSGTSTSEAE
jgi:hypothetical protein